VYSGLSREVYFAIADEASKLGLPVAGHVPNSVSAAEASNAGQKSIEHLLGVFESCSSGVKATPPTGLEKFGTGLRQAAVTYDSKRAAALFAKFVRNGTWFVPTLAVLRAAAFIGDPELTKDERVSLLPGILPQLWKSSPPGADASERLSERKAQFDRELRLVGDMHRAGVKILAGTDTPNPWVFPGTSLHDELALLVKAGLTPAESLRTATLRPAEFFGTSNRLGTVSVGKLADLVLLSADPLADITNTRRIEAVMVDGRLYDAKDLIKLTGQTVSNPDFFGQFFTTQIARSNW
jgi:imidazolonepropionase-like amidohydrolase